MFRKFGVCAGLAVLGLSSAHATEFTFTFVDSTSLLNPFNASGSLFAVENGNTGTYTALGGVLNVTDPAGDIGTYHLLKDPSAPGAVASPSGAFIYDNQVTPGATSPLDVDGLLFTGNAPDGATEINIWGNGPVNGFSFYDHGSGGYVNTTDTGTFSLSTVPGPAALLPFAIGLLRRRRAN